MIKNIFDPNLPVRNPDNHTKIVNLFSDQNAKMSIVKIECSGDHYINANRISDRIYYITGGTGEVYFDGIWHPATLGDCVYIRAGAACSLRGNVTGLVIDSPPFHPDNEIVLAE